MVASPRVLEIINLTNWIVRFFKLYRDAPKTLPEFYRIGKTIGRGAYGKVNLGMHMLTRKLTAIKIISKDYLSTDK